MRIQIIEVEFIGAVFSSCLCLCLVKSHFIFDCLSRPWVHPGALMSLPISGSPPPYPQAGTPFHPYGHQSLLQGGRRMPPPPTLAHHGVTLSPSPGRCPMPGAALAAVAGTGPGFWVLPWSRCSPPAPGPENHQASQHHNDIDLLFLSNYVFFSLEEVQNQEESIWYPFLLWPRFCACEKECQPELLFLVWNILHIFPPFSNLTLQTLFFSSKNH